MLASPRTQSEGRGRSGQESLPNRFPSDPVPVSGSASFLAKLEVQPLNFTASTKMAEAEVPVPLLTPWCSTFAQGLAAMMVSSEVRTPLGAPPMV